MSEMAGNLAGDQDIVAGTANDPVGPMATGQEVVARGSGEAVAAASAQEQVVAGTGGELIVSLTAMENGGKGDGIVDRNLVIAVFAVGDQPTGRHEPAGGHAADGGADHAGPGPLMKEITSLSGVPVTVSVRRPGLSHRRVAKRSGRFRRRL